jgi:putative DNA primase/helicase
MSWDQVLAFLPKMPSEDRKPFLDGYNAEKDWQGRSGLDPATRTPQLSVTSLGSGKAANRLRRALEQVDASHGVHVGANGDIIEFNDHAIEGIASALDDLAIPLGWFWDALVERGAEWGTVLYFFYLLLVHWRGDGHLTDLGNAQRLFRLYGEDLKYCPSVGWLVWDGRRWRRDAIGDVEHRAKGIASTWKRDADIVWSTAHFAPDDKAEAAIRSRAYNLSEWAVSCEASSKLTAMVKVAQTEPGIPVIAADLDTNPWLINAKNGTVDLRTGDLRPHAREDFITMLAPAPYRADACLALWDEFLDQTTGGDKDLQRWMQKASGYSASGDTSQEVFFFAHGPGGSGKSTYAESLKSALGDYAATADFETFVKRSSSGSPRNDIARLNGKRLVVSIEVDEGKELAQGLVKTITGGDTVAARFLYREYFEFKPTFKLMLVANDPPGVDADDDAMWRRIREVPFAHPVPHEQQLPWVKAVLTDPDLAGPAILAWMVEGCRIQLAEGLGTAVAVKEATSQYRETMDVVGAFIDEVCEVGAGLEIRSADLFSAYAKWAISNGELPILTSNALGRRLPKKGFRRGKVHGMRSWKGLALRETIQGFLAWEVAAMDLPRRSALPPGGGTR